MIAKPNGFAIRAYLNRSSLNELNGDLATVSILYLYWACNDVLRVQLEGDSQKPEGFLTSLNRLLFNPSLFFGGLQLIYLSS